MKGLVLVAIALGVSRASAGDLTFWPKTVGEAEKQLNGVAEETRELTDKHLEDHRQDETNRKLNDIEDAIILHGDNDE